MASYTTIDRINDAIIALGRQKDALMRGADLSAGDDLSILGYELLRTRTSWLETRIAHRNAFLAENAGSNREEFDKLADATDEAAYAERVAYLAHERALTNFDAAVGCIY